MGKPIIDKNTGAILFQPTPEEIHIQELEKRITHLESCLSKQRKRRWNK